MTPFSAALGLASGLCLAFGIHYLFIGLRRPTRRVLDLAFAAFAFAYAGAILTAVPMYAAESMGTYLTAARINGLFAVATYGALLWYVSVYTGVRPRPYLAMLGGLLVLLLIANTTRAALVFDSMDDLARVTLPWGDVVSMPQVTEGPWAVLFIVTQLLILAFLVYACVRQFRGGDRRRALALGAGLAFLAGSLVFDALVESGAIDFVLLSDFAFLPFAVIVSLQMSGEVIRTQEALVGYQQRLETMVAERTAELEGAQGLLLEQAAQAATIEERGRLARDLHDAVTQTLYSAALIAEALPAVWERDHAQGLDSLDKLRQLTRGALAEMRALLFELRPTALEAAALEDLIRQQCDALTGRTRIAVDVSLDCEGELPVEVKTNLYRIAQEALSNVAKHARADAVEVTLRHTGDLAALAIRDNGIGFERSSTPSERMGLRIMEERAEKIGADLALDSTPGRGTQVAVRWPGMGAETE